MFRFWLILPLLLPHMLYAEGEIAGFIGAAHTQNSYLSIVQPGLATNLRFSNIRYAGNSFQSPLYYGVRGGYFFRRHIGLEAEFIHLKVFAQVHQSSPVTGTLRGVELHASVPVDSIVQRFSISHGVNLLLGQVVLRQDLLRATSDKLGRLILNLRLGLGGSIPHPESTILGAADEHYQGGSIAGQVAGGAEFRLIKHLYWLGEYKYTRTRPEVRIVSGHAGTLLNSHHIVTGVAVHF
jgi:hypothetical protein